MSLIVVVTGASGYIGTGEPPPKSPTSHEAAHNACSEARLGGAELTKQLLEKGYTVRGTVRDKDAHAKVQIGRRALHSMRAKHSHSQRAYCAVYMGGCRPDCRPMAAVVARAF